MRLQILSITLTVTLVASINAQVCPKTVTSLLDNLLNSPNGERALQILRAARNNPPEVTYGIVEEIVPFNNQILTSGPVALNAPRYAANTPRPINFLPNVGTKLPVAEFRNVPGFPVGNLPSVAALPGNFPRVVGGCGCRAGLPCANPFLPAASPISTILPTSPSLPPVLPYVSKNKYLRKIPLPPPTL